MELVFATNNLNKIKEIQELIPKHITLLSLKDIGCKEEIPETSLTIEGNAIQKAVYIKEHYGYDCFADDTGLEVNALFGAPGIKSARYAGEHKNSEDNIALLLKNIENSPDKTAQFRTVIALRMGHFTTTFLGICKGTIIDAKKGTHGFGYDPIFIPENHNFTFAEMELALKNKISHRAKAVSQLVEHLNQFA